MPNIGPILSLRGCEVTPRPPPVPTTPAGADRPQRFPRGAHFARMSAHRDDPGPAAALERRHRRLQRRRVRPRSGGLPPDHRRATQPRRGAARASRRAGGVVQPGDDRGRHRRLRRRHLALPRRAQGRTGPGRGGDQPGAAGIRPRRSRDDARGVAPGRGADARQRHGAVPSGLPAPARGRPGGRRRRVPGGRTDRRRAGRGRQGSPRLCRRPGRRRGAGRGPAQGHGYRPQQRRPRRAGAGIRGVPRHVAGLPGAQRRAGGPGLRQFRGLARGLDRERDPQGHYTLRGRLPDLPANARLHPGLFEETLPAFVARTPAPVRLVHVDCDLYGSTVGSGRQQQ